MSQLPSQTKNMKNYLHRFRQPAQLAVLSLLIIVMPAVLTVGATKAAAQILDTHVSIELEAQDLHSAITRLEKQMNIVFAYDETFLKLKQKTIKAANFRNESLRNILTT